MDATTIIVAILGSGVVTALVNWYAGRDQSSATAAASNTDTAIKLRDEALEENSELHRQIEELRARVEKLERDLSIKSQQWLDSQAIITHQSGRIADLTRQLSDAERTIAQLQHDLSIEKGRVTKLRNRVAEMGGKPDTGPLVPPSS